MNFSLTSDQIAELSPSALGDLTGWLDDLTLVAQARPRDPVARLVASRRRCSVRTVYNKFKALRQNGPLALLDGRHARRSLSAPEGPSSPAFVQWVHDFYYRIKRSNATPSVQELMLAQLRDWRRDPTNPALRIPGYSVPPCDCARSGYRHPAGWSQRQLNNIKPDEYQLAEARQGRHHSSAMLPPVLTTRVGLAVGSCYMLDDQWYDMMVHYGNEPVRPIGLNVLDLSSGCDIARGIRPLLADEDDGNKALTRAHTMWLLVHVLTVEGYHKDGCTAVMESGSSTVDKTFERHLSLATDNLVSVSIGEVSKEIVRGVLLPSKGNPRFKASRESWFNLVRNRMGHLPLALGMNPDDKPEDTDRLSAEDRRLLVVASQLPPAVLADLQFEGLPWSRFLPLANLISERINQRTQHDLEGWPAMCRERVVYRLGGEWIELAPDTRALIVDRMRRGEVVSRIERMSPREVYEAGRPALRRVSPFIWHHLVPADHAIRRTIPANRQLKIDRREYGPEPIHFLPRYRTPEGEDRPLPAGAEVLVYLSPIDPSYALVVRTDGTPLGLVAAIDKGHRFDEARLHAQYAERNALRAEIGGTAIVHNNAVAEAREQRRKDNAETARHHGVDEKTVRKIERPYQGKKKPASPAKKKTKKQAPTLPKAGGLGIIQDP
ncbi:MAG TPA: hypothetical protein PLA50_03430 [Bacteroidia bacterium]|nr:hypothetical protein [Bacteroidia bacterium]